MTGRDLLRRRRRSASRRTAGRAARHKTPSRLALLRSLPAQFRRIHDFVTPVSSHRHGALPACAPPIAGKRQTQVIWNGRTLPMRAAAPSNGTWAIAPSNVGSSPELSMVVPTRNENGNVPLLVWQLRRALGAISWEVIYVRRARLRMVAAMPSALSSSAWQSSRGSYRSMPCAASVRWQRRRRQLGLRRTGNLVAGGHGGRPDGRPIQLCGKLHIHLAPTVRRLAAPCATRLAGARRGQHRPGVGAGAASLVARLAPFAPENMATGEFVGRRGGNGVALPRRLGLAIRRQARRGRERITSPLGDIYSRLSR